jgi:hypothetical protein
MNEEAAANKPPASNKPIADTFRVDLSSTTFLAFPCQRLLKPNWSCPLKVRLSSVPPQINHSQSGIALVAQKEQVNQAVGRQGLYAWQPIGGRIGGLVDLRQCAGQVLSVPHFQEVGLRVADTGVVPGACTVLGELCIAAGKVAIGDDDHPLDNILVYFTEKGILEWPDGINRRWWHWRTCREIRPMVEFGSWGQKERNAAARTEKRQPGKV